MYPITTQSAPYKQSLPACSADIGANILPVQMYPITTRSAPYKQSLPACSANSERGASNLVLRGSICVPMPPGSSPTTDTPCCQYQKARCDLYSILHAEC